MRKAVGRRWILDSRRLNHFTSRRQLDFLPAGASDWWNGVCPCRLRPWGFTLWARWWLCGERPPGPCGPRPSRWTRPAGVSMWNGIRARRPPLGPLVFFRQFLAAAGLFHDWVKGCPLQFHSPNARTQPPARDDHPRHSRRPTPLRPRDRLAYRHRQPRRVAA